MTAATTAKRAPGRPPLPPEQRSTILPDLRCPPGLSQAIKETAAALGVKVPAWRVQAYREKLERDQAIRDVAKASALNVVRFGEPLLDDVVRGKLGNPGDEP